MASLLVAIIVRLPARRFRGGDELVPARGRCVVFLLFYPGTGFAWSHDAWVIGNLKLITWSMIISSVLLVGQVII